VNSEWKKQAPLGAFLIPAPVAKAKVKRQKAKVSPEAKTFANFRASRMVLSKYFQYYTSFYDVYLRIK